MSESSNDRKGLRRLNHELSVLNAIARELNRSVNLGEALEFTLAQVAELLGLRTGWIWLMNETASEPYLAAAQNLPPALSNDPRRMDGSGYCYCLDTYKRGDLEGAANVNVLTCSRLDGLVDGTDGLRYHASIPLYAQDKKLGVMNVASPDWRSLSPEDLQLLYTIGDLLSIAVERAGLFAQSTRLGAVEERNRLAREIHDTLAQGLTATALQLESADALLDAGSEKAHESLRRALQSRERQPPPAAARGGGPVPHLPGGPHERLQARGSRACEGPARRHPPMGAARRRGRRPGIRRLRSTR